jgi:hypothetical protein
MSLRGYVVRVDPHEGKKGSAEEKASSSVGVVFTE